MLFDVVGGPLFNGCSPVDVFGTTRITIASKRISKWFGRLRAI